MPDIHRFLRSCRRNSREVRGLDLGPTFQVSLGCSKRPGEAKLAGDALNPVRGVQILDQDNLVTGSAALARNDSRVGQEILPNLYEDMSAT